MELASLLRVSTPALFLLLASIEVGPSPLVSKQMQYTNKQENKLISKSVMKDEIKQAAAHQMIGGRGQQQHASSNDIMIVDPKQVAQDWKQAFNMLQNKQQKQLVFKLASGEKIKGITEIDNLTGGYLMIFTIKNLHGMQYKIIKTAEIISLETE
jgi:hypothetical protein